MRITQEQFPYCKNSLTKINMSSTQGNSRAFKFKQAGPTNRANCFDSVELYCREKEVKGLIKPVNSLQASAVHCTVFVWFNPTDPKRHLPEKALCDNNRDPNKGPAQSNYFCKVTIATGLSQWKCLYSL